MTKTSVKSGANELSWDSRTRLAKLLFLEETDANGAQAQVLAAALRSWIGPGTERFALLGDGTHVRSLDAEYRAIWGRFFREHRERAAIALWSLSPLTSVAAEMFRLGLDLELKIVRDESQARAWLRERGFEA